MPEFETKYFGRLSYREEAVVSFPQGLPGFEAERRLLPIEQPINKPLVFLQSLSRPEICFVAVPVHGICPDYQLSMAPEDLQVLGLDGDSQPEIGVDVVCLAVMSLVEEGPPTANMLSPIVVNLKTRRAVQAIQVGSDYSHQYPLAPATAEQPCS